MDENNEQFVAYFLPTRDTILKRKEDEEVSSLYRQEEEYEIYTHIQTQSIVVITTITIFVPWKCH